MTVYDLIFSDEGYNAHPYKDTRGHTTIGVGRCLDCEGITQAEARYLMANDVADRTKELMATSWFPKLDEVRQAAFIDMAFQLGTSGLLGFHDAVDAMEAPTAGTDWDLVADALLDSDWATETPNRAHRIATMVRTGQWPNQP